MEEPSAGEIVTEVEYRETALECAKSFKPTTEREFPFLTQMSSESVDWVDLTKLPSGTAVDIMPGVHGSARYTLEIVKENGGTLVYVWNRGECLKGDPVNILSEDAAGDDFQIWRGILQTGIGMIFPYFRKREGKLIKPTNIWRDHCQSIKVLRHR